MKKTQNKEVKTRRPMKRFIALWVVFVLLVVPFANHVSRDDAKAEGETPTTTEEYYTAVLTESYSENDNGSLYKDNSGKYYLRFRSDENGYVNEAKTYVSDVIKLKTQMTLSNTEHVYSVNDTTTASAIFDTSNYDIEYVRVGNDPVSVYRASIADTEADFVSKDADLSTYTNGVAVYIKPMATQSQTGDAENPVGENLGVFNANMGYTLVGVYKFSKASNPTITWTGTNKTDTNVAVTDSTTKYKSASINVTGGNTTDTAGVWKYKYLKKDESGNAPGDASVKSQEGWGDSCPTLDKDTAGISDGIYYGYAGYFVNNADGTQTLLIYVSTATPVALDVTAPVVTISAEYKDGDSYKPITIDDIDTSMVNSQMGIFYVLKSETIWFSVESDEDASISSSWGNLSVTENVPRYTKEFDVNTIQNNVPYSVTVADNVGNETTASFMLAGRTIYFTNNYSEFRLEGATVKGVNGEQVFDTYDQYINEDWVTHHGEPSVEFTFLSDENIKAVTGEPTNKYEYQITGLTDVVEDVSFSRPYYTTKVSKTLEEGTYTIELKMYNGNFLESYSYGTMVYDKTPPVITQAELQHKNAAGVWEAVAQENIENGKYYINYDEDLSNYRYFVAVNDGTGVGIDEDSFNIPFEKVAEGEYQHILQAPDLAKNMEEATDRDTTVCVKDKIGNESGASFTIPVKQDKATTIVPELRADGTVIDLSDSSKFTTNKNMTLTVTAESSAHITGISVTGNVNGNAQSLIGTLVSVSGMDAKTKLYTVQYTFEIPNGTTLNQLLENGKITVITEKDDKNAEYPFRTILYDHTEPILQSTNVTPEVDLSGLQVDWVKNYTLQYKIISGLGNAESPIAGAEYSISNAGDNNVGSTAIDVTGNTGTVDGNFDIPESVSVTGTTIYMKAKDEAGNEKDQSVNIKVDATKPEITDISVGGYVDAATPVVGTPAVHTSVSDNLTIKTAEMTITYPDGTTVKKVTAASGEDIDMSRSLDYTFEADAPDGDYTIDVYVEDKAGNSNTKSMTFRLDNTAPVVTVKITDGTTAGKQPMTNFDGTSRDYYYGSDVTMLLTYEDTNISSKDVVVTDNGTKVNVTWAQVGDTNKYQAGYVAATEGKHVICINATDHAGNAAQEESVEFVKDIDKPTMTLVVNGKSAWEEPIRGAVNVKTAIADNYALNVAKITVAGPDVQVTKTFFDAGKTVITSKDGSFALEDLIDKRAVDGDYTITLEVSDKAGNTDSIDVTFRVDNTVPVVTVKIAGGITAGKQPQTSFDGTTCDYYYGSDVTTILTYEDVNISSGDVVVTDNGTAVSVTWTRLGDSDKYQATYVVTAEGKHDIHISTADHAGNVAEEKSVEFIKDTQKPTMTLTVNGQEAWEEPIEGAVQVQAGVADNWTLNEATITVVGPDMQKITTLCDAGDEVINKQDGIFALEDLIGQTVADGDYAITVDVSDKAGNTNSMVMYFRVDNTIPVVTAKVADGVTAGKVPGTSFDGTVCDFFYRSDVSVLLTYEDDNMVASTVTVTDNDTPVAVQWTQVGTTNKYQAVYKVTKDGAHTIKIGATDRANNKAVEKQVVFIKDTDAPMITALINGGMVYNESMGVVDLTSNAVVSFSVNDTNEDVNDFNYQLIKTLPDENPVTADVLQTDNRSFGYSDEADYVIKAYSVDKAGNRSAERTIQFRIDKTAPELNITGTASGSTLNAGTTLTFSMTEAFWRDASGTITITRKANDSTAESNYKTIDFKPTARVTTLTETLSETGEYKVTFTGKDRAGHTAEAATYTVRIDTGKPVITLSGVSNNDKTTKQVEFQAQIDEDFYLTKSVSIQATRTYLDPNSYKEKTEDLQITGYNPTAATTLIRNTFTEDGIYEIQVTCKDAAGNEDTQEVSFTIDKTKPVIDPKVMRAYEGTLTSFAWDYDLNDVIYDLTVCDAHMYLNGSEYDGTSEVEDGAYEMKITAEDELGNATEETVSFNLDTKAPTFIVTGVEDGEVKNAQYDVNVSLQLDEDTLDEVALNGSAVEIKDNAATITVTEKGDYKLTMKAHDDAGNVAEKTISFTYGEKSQVLLYVLIGVGALVLLGGGAAIVVAAKKK
ncbi:Ig-like domain repeat protein [Eubacterium sp. MSJ-21]|nr:Ig-like domain repeat protein [Eubacterium sp. MSJ-21]